MDTKVVGQVLSRTMSIDQLDIAEYPEIMKSSLWKDVRWW